MISHFNIKIFDKDSNNITLNNYIKDVSIEKYRKFYKEDFDEKFIEEQRKRIKYNYELNMKYFNSLDKFKFDKYICEFMKKNRFMEVYDLTKYKGISGIYIMVLDKYKQVYIGLSESGIKERIQQHWNAKKEPYKLIWGQAFNSIISIDSFGALDTTRIFVRTDGNLYKLENQLIDKLDKKYLLNRTIGGIGSICTYTNDKNSALLSALANMEKRDFTAFISEKELYEKCNDYDIMMYENSKKDKLYFESEGNTLE